MIFLVNVKIGKFDLKFTFIVKSTKFVKKLFLLLDEKIDLD